MADIDLRQTVSDMMPLLDPRGVPRESFFDVNCNRPSDTNSDIFEPFTFPPRELNSQDFDQELELLQNKHGANYSMNLYTGCRPSLDVMLERELGDLYNQGYSFAIGKRETTGMGPSNGTGSVPLTRPTMGTISEVSGGTGSDDFGESTDSVSPLEPEAGGQPISEDIEISRDYGRTRTALFVGAGVAPVNSKLIDDEQLFQQSETRREKRLNSTKEGTANSAADSNGATERRAPRARDRLANERRISEGKKRQHKRELARIHEDEE